MLTKENFAARLKQADLVIKADFGDRLKSLIQKVNSNKTKHLLVENELKQLKPFYSIYFRGETHFEVDGTQHYLVFQLMYIYFKKVTVAGTGDYICFWKFKELSEENITAPSTIYYRLNPNLFWY